MKRQPPFGYTDPNAPYVDRNTPGAVRGSAVSASFFEWTQNEIIDVINQSGLIPGDELQLWKAIQQSFVITTALTKTVFGPGADFPDLNAANLWLSKRMIASSGFVTLYLAAGKFTCGAQAFSHPNGDRVAITGGALTGGFPVISAFTLTGYVNRAANNTANLAMLRTRFTTELAFSSGTLSLGNVSSVRNFLISGTGAAADGLLIRGAPVLSIQNIAAVGFSGRGIVAVNSGIDLQNIVGMGCVYGVSMEGGVACSASGKVFGLCNGFDGVNAGASDWGASAGGEVVGDGNGRYGIITTAAGRMRLNANQNNYARRNGGHGMRADTGAILEANNTLSADNAGSGYSADDNAKIGAALTSASGNTSTNYSATLFSKINALGSSGGYTPAANTVGNNFSYIAS